MKDQNDDVVNSEREGYLAKGCMAFPMALIDMSMDRLSELERRFYLQATGRNLPLDEIARVIAWQRQGVVDLNSFFVVKNLQPRRLTRIDYVRQAWENIRAACRFKLRAGWE